MMKRILRLFTEMDDELYRINQLESIKLWKPNLLLFLIAIILYIWMAWLGMGTNPLSVLMTETEAGVYNAYKLYFMVGRILFAIIFASLILFLVSYYFHLWTKISYKKLVIMQQATLIVLLFERLLWIPLFVYFGLDWYVSPFSFGIITSYITSAEWVIYFFGAITIYQIWIIFFQVKFLSYFSSIEKKNIWGIVVAWHLLSFLIVATLSYFDQHLWMEWFGS